MARTVRKRATIEQTTVDRAETDRSADVNGVEPTTELGLRLLKLHRRIVAAGDGLSTWEELEREIAERRGGVDAVGGR